MSGKLILHIGAHKTGTTSIQQQLNVHRQRLKAYGIHYCSAFPDFQDNHSIPIASMFRQAPEKYPQNIRARRNAKQCESFNTENRQALTAQIESISSGMYVISGEDIAGLRESEIEQLKRYTAKLFDEVKVVYCIRSPIDMMRSIYIERLKNGTVTRASFDATGLNKRYYEIPRRFAERFGISNVIVYRYEDALEYGDAASYFIEQILGNTDCQLARNFHNRSISASSAWALDHWNRLIGCAGNKKNHLDVLVRRFLRHIPGPKFKFHLPVSAAEIERIDGAVAALASDFGIRTYPALEEQYKGAGAIQV